MVQRVELPSINPAYKKLGKQTGLDSFLLFDSFAEFVDRVSQGAHTLTLSNDTWRQAFNGGGRTYEEVIKTCHTGDLELAEQSNKYLEQLEHLANFDTHMHHVGPSVQGGLVSVPDYLSGTPMNMRLRRRIEAPLAPLTLVIDTSSSFSVTREQLSKRGAALMALVRLLSSKRAVTLYAGINMGNANTSALNGIYFPLETTPLDLARVAYILDGSGVTRGLCYGLGTKEFKGSTSHIPWAWWSADLERKLHHAGLNRLFPGDMLAVPACHTKDLLLNDPEKWLHEKLHEYGFGEHLAPAE